MTEIEKRYIRAYERCGGAEGLLLLPLELQLLLQKTTNLEVKVKMLEAIAKAVETDKKK